MVIQYPLSVSVTSVFRLHVIPICALSRSGYHFVLCVPKQRIADTTLPLFSAGLSTFRKTGARFTAQTCSAHEHRKKTRPATLQKKLPLCPHSFSFLPTSTLTRAHSLLTRFQASACGTIRNGEALPLGLAVLLLTNFPHSHSPLLPVQPLPDVTCIPAVRCAVEQPSDPFSSPHDICPPRPSAQDDSEKIEDRSTFTANAPTTSHPLFNLMASMISLGRDTSM